MLLRNLQRSLQRYSSKGGYDRSFYTKLLFYQRSAKRGFHCYPKDRPMSGRHGLLYAALPRVRAPGEIVVESTLSLLKNVVYPEVFYSGKVSSYVRNNLLDEMYFLIGYSEFLSNPVLLKGKPLKNSAVLRVEMSFGGSERSMFCLQKTFIMVKLLSIR
ncbi:unnamed protein product [Heligmosomoides polygyrus]|uniref:Uncharacterized protein n=1 Tax=Heligmosomoides polygyrus TaxID=6339 RepID=A0A183FI74_HELPZ|nr:unnamed protein product [Heligmosomoides polygyrus]